MARGRPLEFDPDEALEAAMQSFWDLGYEGTSLATLLQQTGLSKSSLYQAFGSKRELFAQCMTRYVDAHFGPMGTRAKASPSAKAFIEGFVLAVADETRGERRGCLLMNTAEAMPDDEALQELVRTSLKRLENALFAAVSRAQAEGAIGADEEPRDLARFLLATLSGLKLLVKTGASRGAVLRAARIALRAVFSDGPEKNTARG